MITKIIFLALSVSAQQKLPAVKASDFFVNEKNGDAVPVVKGKATSAWMVLKVSGHEPEANATNGQTLVRTNVYTDISIYYGDNNGMTNDQMECDMGDGSTLVGNTNYYYHAYGTFKITCTARTEDGKTISESVFVKFPESDQPHFSSGVPHLWLVDGQNTSINNKRLTYQIYPRNSQFPLRYSRIIVNGMYDNEKLADVTAQTTFTGTQMTVQLSEAQHKAILAKAEPVSFQLEIRDKDGKPWKDPRASNVQTDDFYYNNSSIEINVNEPNVRVSVGAHNSKYHRIFTIGEERKLVLPAVPTGDSFTVEPIPSSFSGGVRQNFQSKVGLNTVTLDMAKNRAAIKKDQER
jgi:hypothetical protein